MVERLQYTSSKPFVSCENLLNPVGMLCAQWIREQTTEGVTAHQPCIGDLWLVQEMTRKLVPGSITVCSMGPSVARGVIITGSCRSPPLWTGDGGRRLAALSGLPHSAARRQFFFGSHCTRQHGGAMHHDAV